MVNLEIAHYYDISWTECGNQDLIQICQEFICCCPTQKSRKSLFSVQTNQRQNGCGFRRVQRCVIDYLPPTFSPATMSGHIDIDPAFIQKSKMRYRCPFREPFHCSRLARTPGLLLFGSVDHLLFLRYSIAWIARCTVSIPMGRFSFSTISDSVILGCSSIVFAIFSKSFRVSICFRPLSLARRFTLPIFTFCSARRYTVATDTPYANAIPFASSFFRMLLPAIPVLGYAVYVSPHTVILPLL